jgi:hypothetical protein
VLTLAGLLQDLFYIILVAIVMIDGAIAKLMRFIGIGEHPYLSTIIGSAIGFVVIWISPTAGIAAMIVAGVATIGSNLLLTHVIAL